MLIGLIPNPDKDMHLNVTKRVAQEILQLGGTPVLSSKYRDMINIWPEGTVFDNYSECSLLVCLGGDGTFLTAVNDYLSHETPIIGINLGSVGFLAEIDQNQTFAALKQIFSGKYTIEKRMLVNAVCYDRLNNPKISITALNDIVIARGGISRILNLDLFINSAFVEKLPGDGIIVSTPTGSTAYSLSAGGPIVEPGMELMVVTPLNPHTLHNRSYVVAAKSEIKIVIKEYPFKPLLTADGSHVCTLEQLDMIKITKANNHMMLVKLNHSSFYQSLTDKIYHR